MWETLTRRYNNRRHIVNSYIGRFINQKKITTETPKAIRETLDITSECITTLKSIDIPTDKWDDIIVYIVIQKLDSESHRLFEQRIETLDRLPTWKDLSEFLELRFRTLEAVKSKDNPSTHRNPSTTKAFTANIATPINCVYCNADHRIYACKSFCQLDVNDRQQYIQKQNLCFNCLKKGHSSKHCAQSTCRKCGRKHHTILHGYSVPAGITSSSQSSQNNPTANLSTVKPIESITMKTSLDTSPVVLATALVTVQSHRNHSLHTLRALVDQGSQASLITEGACQELGLKKTPIQGNIVGVSSKNTATRAIVEIEIISRHDPKTKIKVKAYVLRNLTSYIPERVNTVDWPQLNSLQLADYTFTKPGRIDLLLGAEIFADIIKQGVLVHRDDNRSLVAQETSLGWLISGSNKKPDNQQTIVSSHHVKIEIDTALRRFWELEEEIPKQKVKTNDEEKCEQHYKKTHSRTQEGRYIVHLPFSVNPPDIGESETIALKRLASVERKFKTFPDLQTRYTEFMQDYLDQGHMEPVETENRINYYLPHHAVINDQHLTTKLRVVFDASASTTNGKSLNDNLLIGPTLQSDLRDTTLRWRRHAIVLVGDIRQMYRQINIVENDRDYQRIVWRWSLDEPIQHYRLTTVTYGTSCAPYLAIKTLKQLAEDEKDNFSEEVINTLSSDFYVDDLLTGTPTIDEAIKLKDSLTEVLYKGGFALHKWASNRSEIEDLTQGIRKILGIDWNDRTDKFELNFDLKEREYEVPTKRTILQDIAKLYDPSGWLAPIVVKAKVFMQKLWAAGLDWDDEIPETLRTEWLIFRSNLTNMPTIELDRWIGFTDNVVKVEIHGFSDASDVAYSAVVYCRTILAEAIKVTMIEAKTKVAPVKKISTPRLELCGAVLLAKLLDRVKTALNIPLNDIYAWTDATIVLAWLQRPSNYWKTFVANRVTEITNRINTNRWHHVASRDNPADVASRGLSPLELQSHELWWNGPPWLQQHHDLPVTDISEIISATEDEKKCQSVKVQCSVVVVSGPEKEKDIINKYSNLNKLVRVISYCMRFYYKCKAKAKKETLPLYTPYLNTVEMQHALNRLIKLSQITESIDLKNIKNLNPFTDHDQILKVGGRIQNACCNRETKHPIILAKNSRLAYLLVKEAHAKTLHGGVQLMLNHIRNKYHIIGVKHQIKKCIRECISCHGNSAKLSTQLMGNLPKDRVTPQRPFLVSGVDFAGPVILKLFSGRGSNRTQKAYIALFICTVTKAVHIELVTSLSSECFIAAFRRFTARRGHCKKLISDCGTNFKGATKELEIMASKSTANMSTEIAELLALDGTEWQFNPAGAPHMGGLWESNIKSMKRHINRVLGDTKLTYEEYSTLLCQIESCLNSRPLTSLDNDQEGTTVALTPGHFLIGENLIAVPDENLSEVPVPYNKRWIYLQKKLQSFWHQWSQEYLVNLQKRQKWTSTQTNLKVDDIVLVKDENLPPTKWLMGRIVEVHPGSDGLIRVVSLKCKNSILKRPIHKLCLLPTEESD